MMRRRRAVIAARERWLTGRWRWLARAIGSQAGQALLTPRAGRVIELLELGPGKRYLDIGCGTASYAHLLAARAGCEEPPICLDIAPGPGPVDLIGWPERLPFPDASFDCITSFYFIRRFDDDVVHGFARELARVLAPGGRGLVLEIAPVVNPLLNRLHARVVGGGCPAVDLRGWGRLAATFSEAGYDAIDLVNVGPFLVPPVPRVGLLLRHAPGGADDPAG
jgi:SAM-dependent methyltransferase